MKDVKEIKEIAESAYSVLNKFITAGTIPLIDRVYPNHDGVQDAEEASELMLLRDRLAAIADACDIAVYHINSALGEEENDEG